MSAIDLSSVNVALPRIERYFETDLPTVQWVPVGYALAISVMLMPVGRLGDLFNRKRVYIAGFAVFALGATAAGLSQSIGMLIGAKVFQGFGAAMIQGNGVATVLSIFPGTERGKALGLHMTVVGLGVIVGPALGGALVGEFGWRSVFFVNGPVSLIGIAAAAVILNPARLANQDIDGPRQRFDWLGAVLSAGALLVFLLVVTNGYRAGWASGTIVAGFVGVVAFLAAFVWWELRHPSPMLDIRLFKRRLVALGVSAGWLNFLAGASVIFLMSFYLQNVKGFEPRTAGLILIPGAAALAVLGPISGRLSDRFGWRKLNLLGLALSSSALFTMAAQLSDRTPLTLIIPLLVLNTSGTGLFNAPNNSSILSAVERSRYGVVSAMTQLMRNSANVTSIALATTIVATTMAGYGVEPSLSVVAADSGRQVADAFIAGMHRVFLAFGSLLLLAMVLSYLKGERVNEAAPGAPAPAHRSARTPGG